MMIGLGATGASAARGPSSEAPAYGVVSGQLFGPEDGYEVTTETYPVYPGQEDLDVIYGDALPEGAITPLATWGTSYAKSTHPTIFTYKGYARAAGNVFNGQRIIKVCIWYSHPGRTGKTVCSSATSNGSGWTAGSEATVTFIDNLSINWPKTVFNISTTRINPNIY